MTELLKDQRNVFINNILISIWGDMIRPISGNLLIEKKKKKHIKMQKVILVWSVSFWNGINVIMRECTKH